ncbi:ATP binding [Marasmius crinis-equi]|uniref:ATP binding n=1 Tax=Marasmius crinis-equi TaxID=585013 RepID=A0ABR3F2F9_9AGAR
MASTSFGVPAGSSEDPSPESVGPSQTWVKGAKIRKGAIGEVYLGMDLLTGGLEAIEEIHSSSLPVLAGNQQDALELLRRKVNGLKSTLSHENVVKIFDVFYYGEDIALNIYMEYIPGGSVAGLIRSYGGFEEALAKNFAAQIFQALQFLHDDANLAHGDLKAENVLVDNKGSIKAGHGVDRLEARKSRWMSPETVITSKFEEKGDIWSAGCVIIEMSTGKAPWGDISDEEAISMISEGLQPPFPDRDCSQLLNKFMRVVFVIDPGVRPSATLALLEDWFQPPDKGATGVQ